MKTHHATRGVLPNARHAAYRRFTGDYRQFTGACQRQLVAQIGPGAVKSLLLDGSAAIASGGISASPRRISEACGLTWADVAPREDGRVQITVLGKGAKVRTVLLPASVRRRLDALRGAAPADAPVFRSRKHGHLDRSSVLRVVKAAARRAGLSGNIVTHGLRHSHATHSLAHGAPLHLVQQTLGHSSLSTTGIYCHARPDESSAMFIPI